MTNEKAGDLSVTPALFLVWCPAYEFFSSSCLLISNSASCGTTSQAISCITFSESCSTARRAIASIIAGDNSCAEFGADCTPGCAEYCGGASGSVTTCDSVASTSSSTTRSYVTGSGNVSVLATGSEEIVAGVP